MTGQRILTKDGERIKKEMSRIAKEALQNSDWNVESLDDTFLYMDMLVYFNRRGRDADNILKALQDSLQGILFKNDSQVLPRTQKILYDTTNPRIELTLTPVEYVGIFENAEDAKTFEEKCRGCTRYLNGRCSILNDSLIGTVREEIGDDKNPICSVYKEKK